MKAVLIAVGLLVAGATTASAYEGWHKDRFPYEKRHHHMCMEKAERLHRFEHRASADGRITPRERDIIHALKRDLDRTCGGWRWRG